MADPVTRVNIEYCRSANKEIIGLWRFDPVDSTAFVEISLPALSESFMAQQLMEQPGDTLGSKSYAIDIRAGAVSCNSPDFDFSILCIDDDTKRNTIYEVGTFTNINLSDRNSFETFIIRNRDNPIENKFYIYIQNNSKVIPLGTVFIELVYITLQDRDFADNVP